MLNRFVMKRSNHGWWRDFIYLFFFKKGIIIAFFFCVCVGNDPVEKEKLMMQKREGVIVFEHT